MTPREFSALVPRAVRWRFLSKVDFYRADPCWVWVAAGANSGNGYGRFDLDGKLEYAYTLAFTWSRGPLPPGTEPDHTCQNRACIRPDHLDPVTHAVNCARGNGWAGQNARTTHCPKGHPYSGANLMVIAGKRECRACRNARARAKRAARRAKPNPAKGQQEPQQPSSS